MSDRYPITPASFVLALLRGLRLEPDICRKILTSCKTPPSSGKEMTEMCYDTGHNSFFSFCHDEYKACNALADGYWIIDSYKDRGIKILSCLDPEYPQPLFDLDRYPLVLYLAGNADLLSNSQMIAIVGTREPSEYGKKIACRLGGYFAERGWTIVSGLALGCDTQTHRGCMSAGKATVAVLAHGLDIIYPRESLGLAKEILNNGGCWVSEYPKNTKPERNNFVGQGRILVALSKAVIVVESEVTDETMDTAAYAVALKRKLGCMGYNKDVPEARMGGNDLLVKEGKAVWLVDAKDLEQFIESIAGAKT